MVWDPVFLDSRCIPNITIRFFRRSQESKPPDPNHQFFKVAGLPKPIILWGNSTSSNVVLVGDLHGSHLSTLWPKDSIFKLARDRQHDRWAPKASQNGKGNGTPAISGKSRLAKYYIFWSDGMFTYIGLNSVGQCSLALENKGIHPKTHGSMEKWQKKCLIRFFLVGS